MGKPTSYEATVVVPLPDDAEVARAVGDGYDRDAALNVMKMMSGTGDFFPALAGMVKAVFGEPDIDAKHREVVILRAASVLNSPYEWQANEQMARNAGLTTAEIETVAGDGNVEDLDTDYQVLIAATDELLKEGTLADGTLQALLDTFGVTTTRKYIATIAWFSLLSLFLNGTRVPLETTDKIGQRTSPLG
ncbi:carboxymuconolactone decarboxylase family protein [Mycolicibacterium baixiangningiae]|uniref:carboxymuconolactone decarboxylase family protein n=1 Tax=Mycolicibacterium baixiangningiae TaxID=2761578 RepID=UPI001865F986|nr:carboxymuconolactone decarboxylase family protein [Mycolicibacterium baixiangningiae]